MATLSILLNKRVVIQSRDTGQDAYGQPLTTWTNVATVWAEIRDVSGREMLAAAAVQNAVTTKIRIRYLSGVLPSMRVLHGADIYNIEAPLNEGNKTLLLMCVKGLSNG